MRLQDEILINQYGQGIISHEILVNIFENLAEEEKKGFLGELLNLIIQSKPLDVDIDDAIVQSGLKASYTPCALIKKGISQHILEKIISLPNNEYLKSFILLLSLFKIAYNRRFQKERGNPDKWWYWDLSDEQNIDLILKNLQ